MHQLSVAAELEDSRFRFFRLCGCTLSSGWSPGSRLAPWAPCPHAWSAACADFSPPQKRQLGSLLFRAAVRTGRWRLLSPPLMLLLLLLLLLLLRLFCFISTSS